MNGSGRAATTRAAIYARYASGRRSSASIDAQVRRCRKRVIADGGELVEVYSDAASSGASTLNRPGLQALLADAKVGHFNLVVVEALGRLSRDQADLAKLYNLLRSANVGILTLYEGEISELRSVDVSTLTPTERKLIIALKAAMKALLLEARAKQSTRAANKP